MEPWKPEIRYSKCLVWYLYIIIAQETEVVGVIDEDLARPRNNKFPDAALLVTGRGIVKEEFKEIMGERGKGFRVICHMSGPWPRASQKVWKILQGSDIAFSVIYSFIHSFIQQIFLKHLCARHYSRCLGSISEPKQTNKQIQNSALLKVTLL